MENISFFSILNFNPIIAIVKISIKAFIECCLSHESQKCSQNIFKTLYSSLHVSHGQIFNQKSYFFKGKTVNQRKFLLYYNNSLGKIFCLFDNRPGKYRSKLRQVFTKQVYQWETFFYEDMNQYKRIENLND